MEDPGFLTSVQTRNALLDAAERVFAERGLKPQTFGTSPTRPAWRMDWYVTTSRRRKGLWREVIDRAIDRYGAAMTPHAVRAAAHAADPLAATRAAARGFRS